MQQVCGSAPVEEALLSNTLLQPGAAEAAAISLVTLGLRTALDLRLLGGGPEAEELLGELKMAGVSLGDRAKVRLFVDGAHLSQLLDHTSNKTTGPSEQLQSVPRRALQDKAEPAGGGMSTDTLAIVLAVLVGAAGYLVQAYTTRRAESSNVEQAT